MITIVDVARALERLTDTLGLPEKFRDKGADRAQIMERLARTWLDVLRSLEPSQLDAAVKAYLSTDAQYLPTPGKLLAVARDVGGAGIALPLNLESRYRQWEAGHLAGGCPVCGSVIQQVGTRFGVLHDHQKHFETGVGYVGQRTGPTRGGAMVASGAIGDTAYLHLETGQMVRAGQTPAAAGAAA